MQTLFSVLAAMLACIAAGSLLRVIPAPLNPSQLRLGLTHCVYWLFLPCLTCLAMWQAPVGWISFKLSAVAAASVGCGLLLGAGYAYWRHLSAARLGALLIAAGFTNVVYLGIPLLTHLYGPWTQGLIIQYDTFASTPLLFISAAVIGARYGARHSQPIHPLTALLKVPALWGAILGLVANLLALPLITPIELTLGILSQAVIPLMLVSIGLALNFAKPSRQDVRDLSAVSVIQLGAIPGLAWLLTPYLALPEGWPQAVVLLTGLPCMLLGLVFCEKYQLDSAFYATAVAVTSVLSLLTLPLWFMLLH